MNHEMIKNKVIGTTAIIVGNTAVAAKMLIFVKVATKIAEKTNPIIGFITLVGIEHVYHELGRDIIKKCIR